MAAVYYFAKRSIITNSFLLEAITDISVSDVDNSFNASSSDLSGLLANEWVYVSGSPNIENNGWHQLSVNSITGKITTLSTLVTEAAGAAITIQGYEHGEGEQYSLDIDVRTAEYKEKENKKTNESLSGLEEQILHNTKIFWSITTAIIDEDTEKKYWLEFLHSVRVGETFTFDVYGTVATSDNPLQATLVGVPNYQRIKNTKKIIISFVVKLA